VGNDETVGLPVGRRQQSPTRLLDRETQIAVKRCLRHMAQRTEQDRVLGFPPGEEIGGGREERFGGVEGPALHGAKLGIPGRAVKVRPLWCPKPLPWGVGFSEYQRWTA